MSLSEDELTILLMMIGAAGMSGFYLRTTALHPMFLEGNPGLGLIRLVGPLSVLWTFGVITYFGDPSIVGVYVFFYLLMAYVATTLFGLLAGQMFGLFLRTDVYEQKNFAAALFLAAFGLATGIVFGASLWGEADPNSDYEGGWWIPAGFFLLGWIVLCIAMAIYFKREKKNFAIEVRQNRDVKTAQSAAIFALSTAVVLIDGVAGDFWGWRHGLLTFGVVAVMLLVHEKISSSLEEETLITTHAHNDDSEYYTPPAPSLSLSLGDFLYPLLALLAFGLNRWIDASFGVHA